jgi:integrase
VFQKRYKGRDGKPKYTRTWFVKYYVGGKPIEAATETEDYDEAVGFLRKRMASTDLAGFPERVRIGQLLDAMIEWYTAQKKASLYTIDRHIEIHLRPWFGKMKAQTLSTAELARYVAMRRKAKTKPANGTINRELGTLRRALKLGAQQDPPLVTRVPRFDMLPEADPREGTVSHENFRAVRDLLPSYARIALVIGYYTGARKGELRQIRKAGIDFKAGRIELRAPTTKNRRGRWLPIYGEMAAELEMAIAAGDAKCAHLIQDGGKPVQQWRKSWATACELAGIEGTLFHDLRRTAVTNMIEAGLSEKEAMEISGHRTRAVFDRYHIVSERRLKEMAGKLGAHLAAKDLEAAKAKKGREAVN